MGRGAVSLREKKPPKDNPLPGGSDSKESACNAGDSQCIETWAQSLGQEDPLEKETATHSSILAWRIPWTKEPARLQSMGSQRVRTWLSNFYFHDPYPITPPQPLSQAPSILLLFGCERRKERDQKPLSNTDPLCCCCCLALPRDISLVPEAATFSAPPCLRLLLLQPPCPLLPFVSSSTAPRKTLKSGEQKRCLLRISVSMCGK